MLLNDARNEIKKVIDECGGMATVNELVRNLVQKRVFKTPREVGWYLRKLDGNGIEVDKLDSIVRVP